MYSDLRYRLVTLPFQLNYSAVVCAESSCILESGNGVRK